jgi:hypothetical protein
MPAPPAVALKGLKQLTTCLGAHAVVVSLR